MRAFCRQLAAVSGPIIRAHFGPATRARAKADQSPVTIADLEAERAMRALIQQQYPEHGIMGEELGAIRPDARWQWVIDPIDGTRSFVAGGLDFGTCVALLEDGVPILGMIHHPILNECVLGDHTGTTCHDVAVHIDPAVRRIEDCILLTTDIDAVAKFQPAPGFTTLSRRVQYVRTWGNCFAYTLLARGYPCIVVDPIMALWDIAALIPIVRGAGGCITDYQGREPLQGTSIVASPPAIHEEVIRTLNAV